MAVALAAASVYDKQACNHAGTIMQPDKWNRADNQSETAKNGIFLTVVYGIFPKQ
jgi:hypothetical protein